MNGLIANYGALSITEAVTAEHDPFYPRLWPGRLEQIRKHKKPAGIFLDDMSDWMGDYWPREWTEMEIDVMKQCPQHRFYTLTKQPQNLIKFSPFPENCYVGVTATNNLMFQLALHHLDDVKVSLRFISFEPLLNRIEDAHLVKGFDWLIIGAMTGRKKDLLQIGKQYSDLRLMSYGKIWSLQPKLEYVQEIVEAAAKAKIPVFLKNNLVPMIADSPDPEKTKLYEEMGLRQEFPNKVKDEI